METNEKLQVNGIKITELMYFKKCLYVKKCGLQLELGALKKDGDAKNNDGKILYSFMSAESLNSEMKPLLYKHNLDIANQIKKANIERVDKKMIATVEVELEIIDLETGYSELHNTFGYGEDYGDKALGKAYTEAIKRWLFKNFFVTSQDSKLFDIDFTAEVEDTKPVITPKEPAPDKKEPKKTEPKQDDDAEPKVNLRAALTTLTVNKETDTNCILAALKSKGFKTAADVPENMHQTILNISKELYKEFLKSEQYKKDMKNEKN